MSVYEFGDTTIYEAVVHGYVENAPPITQPFPDWWPLRDQVYNAARSVIPFETANDFYIVYRDGSSGQVGRVRWRVDAEMFGPELRWEESAGASRIVFQLKRTMYTQQYTADPTNPIPWFDFRDLYSAVLGRQALGSGPVEIPLASGETATFTPQAIQYSRVGWDDVLDPYLAPVYGWTFNAEVSDPFEPALWVVPVGQQDGVKVSVCENYNGERWSDFTEPAPAFEPLPEPSGP